ncbi:hypothetical protein CAPTEDRAFT_106895 [Capitella teleta]|uniref:Neurotransmitter-gated ion-channel ligand-binding domain-containing protein n=1 Tax=Capitella teleta TaxID=283909 RepID=R7TM93_CAPTE|nr:hypothetical protein CAPTEDRAFT_106895 [Capitella teleta]|eukprot:ELT94958.1 hypothetical protein CAPTEDRAFT_106895 [Capitella teleta]
MEANDIDVRPTSNISDTVTVRFGIALISIDSVELISFSDYKLTVSCWFRQANSLFQTWNDPRLSWNPEDYGGLANIRIPNSYIWKPDIVLYNNFEMQNEMNEETLAMVYSDGTVLWIPNGKMTVKMSKEESTWTKPASYYASFKFGSWTYDGFMLDIDLYEALEDVDLTDYIPHNTFELAEHSAVKNVKYYPCCAEPYPDLTFSLKLTGGH